MARSSAKQPFLPFFVGDFVAATAEWEGEAISLYATLMLHQWSLGSIPSDPKRICKLIRWDWELFSYHWRTVRRKFDAIEMPIDDATEERLINARLERHRDKSVALAKKNAAAGVIGAKKRWHKDGERHRNNKANAIIDGGERHANGVADAIENDGERHENSMANGARSANGVTDSNPSHPIPSQIPNPDISSRIDTHQARELVPPSGLEAKAKAPKGQDRGSRIPDPFEITEDMRAWAQANTPNVDVKANTAEFVDYWRGVPGTKGRKLDWIGTWRNRMRECEGRARRNGNGRAAQPAKPGAPMTHAQVMADLDRVTDPNSEEWPS